MDAAAPALAARNRRRECFSGDRILFVIARIFLMQPVFALRAKILRTTPFGSQAYHDCDAGVQVAAAICAIRQ
jgi:hypothetical protein